jgi:hypothetical protein
MAAEEPDMAVQVYQRKKFVSAKTKREDEIRRAAANVALLIQGDYPQVKAEVDLETAEVGEDAYVWIMLDTPELLDEVRVTACNYATDLWEAENIFIVPRMRSAVPPSDAPAENPSKVSKAFGS